MHIFCASCEGQLHHGQHMVMVSRFTYHADPPRNPDAAVYHEECYDRLFPELDIDLGDCNGVEKTPQADVRTPPGSFEPRRDE